jgi:hypothetical protein
MMSTVPNYSVCLSVCLSGANPGNLLLTLSTRL